MRNEAENTKQNASMGKEVQRLRKMVKDREKEGGKWREEARKMGTAVEEQRAKMENMGRQMQQVTSNNRQSSQVAE